MRKLSCWAICCCAGLWAQSLIISPQVVTRCAQPGLGRVQLSWSTIGTGAVVVRLGSATGEAMSGEEPPSGSVVTGDWVTDGLVFVLASLDGRELARATARVSCSTGVSTAESYFPLRVGNQWVYRRDSRQGTAFHETWRVTGTEMRNGQEWFVLGGISQIERMRMDGLGRIYIIRSVSDSALDSLREEVLWIDPVDNRGQMAITRTAGPDLVNFSITNPLIQTTGQLRKGVGIVTQTTTIIAGSSGGFDNGLRLQFARTSEPPPMSTLGGSAIELSAESSEFDVTGHNTTDCILPCYFAACGFAGGQPDPKGSYKPCFQARLRVSGSKRTPVLWELLDIAGTMIYRQTEDIPEDLDESILFRQIPLYDPPARPLAPGEYRLKVSAAAGTQSAESVITVR